MLSKQYPLVFLSTTLLVTLTSQSSIAFTIKQNFNPLNYASISVFLGQGGGLTTLNAANPLDPFSGIKPFVSQIKRGGTDGLLADLQLYRDEGWSFQRGRNLKVQCQPSVCLW